MPMQNARKSRLVLQRLVKSLVRNNVNKDGSAANAASQFSTLGRPLSSVATLTNIAPPSKDWVDTRRAQHNDGVGLWPGGHQRMLSSHSTTEELDLTPPDVGTVRIDGYHETGFIVGDVQVEGSILCFGDLWLSWKPRRVSEITDDSLSIVDLLKPAPDLVILGTGQKIERIPEPLCKSLFTRGVSLEVLDTVNAVATFNILNQEGRKVIGALLPLTTSTR